MADDVVCAIYCRVSTGRQKEKHTIASQKRILPAMARDRGWKIYRMYVDDGISGEVLSAMPALRELLFDAERGRFSKILVIDIDRVTRFRRESERAMIIDICLENDIEIVTPDGIYDLTDRNGRLQFAIKGTVALYEKETIRERCLRGISEKRRAGKWLGGTPPAGYRYDREKRRLVEQTGGGAKAIKKIMELAKSHSARETARMMGGAYSPRMIRRMLEDHRLLFYAGFMQAREGREIDAIGGIGESINNTNGQIIDLERLSGNPGDTARGGVAKIEDINKIPPGTLARFSEFGIVIRGEWPPLIGINDILEIKAAKAERCARGQHVSTRPAYLLTGLGILRCGYCGRSVKAWVDRRVRKDGSIYERAYYRCTSIQLVERKRRCCGVMIEASLLEDKIWNNICNTIGKPECIQVTWDTYQRFHDSVSKETKAAQARLIEVKKKQRRLAAAIAHGIVEMQDAVDVAEKLRQEAEAAQEDLRRLMREDSGGLDLDWLQEIAAAATYAIHMEDKRMVIAEVIEEIRVYLGKGRGDLRITYKFPVQPDGSRTRRVRW